MAEAKNKKVMGHSVPDDEWVARVAEEILDPELPIIDAHHHLWLRNGHDYLLPEFAEEVHGGHNVVATVYAECESMYRNTGPEALRSLGETEFATGCAAMADSGTFGDSQICKGIVGSVDLRLGERTREVFEQHLASSGGRFKGIRFRTAWDDDARIPNVCESPRLLLDDQVQAGARVMADLGLALDVWVYHPQLAEVAQLAAGIPELTIVINHTGVPILGGSYRDRREQVFADWLVGIKEAAAFDNVFMKLGALPIRRHGDGVDRNLPPSSEEIASAWRPWMSECIEAFGTHRCIFESNFPVQKLFASYNVTWNAFKRLAHGASEAAKSDLFYKAALTAYRLEAAAQSSMAE